MAIQTVTERNALATDYATDAAYVRSTPRHRLRLQAPSRRVGLPPMHVRLCPGVLRLPVSSLQLQPSISPRVQPSLVSASTPQSLAVRTLTVRPSHLRRSPHREP